MDPAFPVAPRRGPSLSARLAPAQICRAVLVVLTIWEIGEQLTDTLWPGLLGVVPYVGICPDIAFGLAGATLLLRGWRTDRGWLLIGLGAICWALGDVYWELNLATSSSPPVPSWADAGYLSFCPLTFAGILSLVRGQARHASRTLIADAVAAGLATGAASAALVVEPVLDHASGGAWAIATNLAYPICDLALLGLLVGALAVGEWRLNRRLVLLALGVLAFWVADSRYLVVVATNSYSQREWFNGLWYLSPVLTAWAAWVPYANESERVAVHRGTSSGGIVMLLLFAFAALAVLGLSSFLDVGPVAVGLSLLAILVIMARLVMTWQENVALLGTSRVEATTDALTGLGNRRALAIGLRRAVATSSPARPGALVLFDLDGFKHYNDSFGHPAGDALLARLGDKLAAQVGGSGSVYRMGGDEFCALLSGRPDELDALIAGAANALAEGGDGFDIGCSYGAVFLPEEADSAEEALRLADTRMYSHKRSGRASATGQSAAVLLRVLEERNPTLHAHLHDVGALATQVAAALGLKEDQREAVRRAAELHDVGKVAIPDAILEKPARLDAREREFINRHTIIGERILSAAPALAYIGGLVRSSHENFDGSGYPDGLSGGTIPLGSRIISVCDAFDAMTTDRPYRRRMTVEEALSELERCSGAQFDPVVVAEFCQLVRDGAAEPLVTALVSG